MHYGIVIFMSEKDSKYYDDAYSERTEYSCHYNESYYLFVWKHVVELLKQYTFPRIIELGCGTGQFAHYLRDNGYINYTGYDFSKKAIGIAKEMSSQRFEYRDIRNPIYYDCDIVICLEVLEHVNKDVDIIKSIPKNTDIIFSLPKFDDEAHVRFFRDKEEIINRYDISYSDIIEMDNFILCRGYNDK